MTDIAAVGGQGGFRPPPPKPLSDDQKNLISETLSNYDPDNLTAEDAKAIATTFRDAGIQPGKELASAMEDAGFDAREVGELAGVKPPKGPPPPPPQGQSLNTEGLQAIEDILEDYDLSDLSEEDEEEILSAFEDAGLIGKEGSVFNLTV
ncbi:MAG: hypothetical protein HWE25_07225 [Alphaproteobacteria bacterium]|nr:hypothetical protein [Alphaproteobacteria bacterium]